MLNATGGWTSIDEELDATSTNPVQNKTLYNLETYHTLTGEVDKSSLVRAYMNLYIDDDKNFIVKTGTCINLYVKDPIVCENGKLTTYTPRIFNGGFDYKILTNKYSIINEGSHNSQKIIELSTTHNSSLIKNLDESYDYSRDMIYFTTGGVILKLFFTGDEFIIVNNPVLIDCKNGSNANAIKYANGLTMQWFNNVHLHVDGSKIYLPLSMNSTTYTIIGSRINNVNFKTPIGFKEKQKEFFVADPDGNDFYCDFFIIGY